MTHHYHHQHQQLPYSPPHHLEPTMASSNHHIYSNPIFYLLGLCDNVYTLKTVHGLLVVHGLTRDISFNTKLVSLYGSFGHAKLARLVFDRIPDPDFYSCKVMLRWYFLNDLYREILGFYALMRLRCRDTDNVVFSVVLKACSESRNACEGRKIHCQIVKAGSPDALLDMYVKCGAIRDARCVFDELYCTDLVSWTAMIVGYTQNGFPKEALKLFTDNKWAGILPNNVTIASILSACAQLGNLSWGRLVHALAIKLGLVLPNVTNALVDMYAKFHKNEYSRYLFEQLSDKDVITWNSIISGFSQNGSVYEALELFYRMRRGNVLPDAVTIVSALSALASLGALQVGSSLHAYSVKKGLLSSNVFMGTALLTFYGKCGDVRSARKVFNSMEEKSTITWSAMIGGYGIQGDGHNSLALFGEMLRAELKPNEATFTSILSACSHTGMVRDGWRLFTSMCQDYNFVPSMKHYSCMVDLLARSGRLEEAYDFISNMPLRPDISLFGAFLHGCGLYSRFDLGEVAIKRMMELHPDEASYYVLMCNLYAADGRWNQVRQVRELMVNRRLNKSPGCSLMELDIGYDSTHRVASVG
ncbi:hypothetical protein Tsubulata_043498 [Turnera subulata]|uniref:Pentacotripeptide-repeat region of PRORP domain-containing protein n=1 Tax=Turnera subulata TaxID=218843 RepID=A0A9Q0F5G3_9ROSI|nr:hypothetical protein Tsubulata_043498 [Turnera subulata]